MPEGHTIHRIARDQSKLLLGHCVELTSPQGRFADEALQLTGSKLLRIEPVGKHLIYHWQKSRRKSPTLMHIHLGLYGKYRTYRSTDVQPRGLVRVRFQVPEVTIDLNGPNQCELYTSQQREALLNRLGPDPLDPSADPERAWAKIHASKSALGALLLNQSVIAGVGNIYRAEVLFFLGIHPNRSGNNLSREEFDRLWQQLVDWLQIGVKYNRIITNDMQNAGKALGRLTKAERLKIYKKEYCPNCESPVTNWSCGGRTIYACGTCQE